MRAAWTGWAAAAAVVAAGAAAQTLDVQRPRTLVVGAPPGSRADRLDGARTGSTSSLLPTGGLRTEWRAASGALLDEAPLVDAGGTTYVVGTRGEVIAFARDGSELWRASTGAVQPGPAALLADDTFVFADALGEAVAVRGGQVRWRARFGRGDAAHPAPLPLDDGGVVIATAHDLAVLDAEGHERARTTVPEGLSGPLVAAAGQVVVVGASGAVWRWSMGPTEPSRVGRFGSPPSGGAALEAGHTLLAVTAGGAHLEALDLTRGTLSTRAAASAGVWLGPPALAGGAAYLVLLAPTAELAVALDGSGAERARVLLASRVAPAAADGGLAAVTAIPHAPLIVDAAGTVAFATAEGAVGVAVAGSAELIADVCPRAHGDTGAGSAAGTTGTTATVGLAPLGAGAFVAACHGGGLVAVRGASGPGERPAPRL